MTIWHILVLRPITSFVFDQTSNRRSGTSTDSRWPRSPDGNGSSSSSVMAFNFVGLRLPSTQAATLLFALTSLLITVVKDWISESREEVESTVLLTSGRQVSCFKSGLFASFSSASS